MSDICGFDYEGLCQTHGDSPAHICEDEYNRLFAALAQAEREREALDAYEAIYRRLGESSAYAKLDSDVWYAITKAHDLARAALEGR